MRNLSNYLFFIFLIIFSCKTIEIEDKKSYKKINEKNIIINRDNCTSDIYINKETNKKLNGKYRIKFGYGTIYTDFINGLVNGKYQEIRKFDNNLYRTKSHFIKGNKYGIEEDYFNNKLFRKCNYVNNVKHGKEYHFDKKNNDTIDVVTHYYNPNYAKPNFSSFYFSEIKKQEINEIRPSYRHSNFIGKFKLEGKYHYTHYSLNFEINNFFHITSNCKKITCIIEINNVYYLGIANSISLHLYKLKKQP